MEQKSFIKNDFIEIIAMDQNLYIQSFASGYTMEHFNKILVEYPQIKIFNFMALRKAILQAPSELEFFGELRPDIEVEISNDQLKAHIILNLPEWELAEQNRPSLTKRILEALQKKGVVFGMKHDTLNGSFQSKQKILIAEGTEPIDGEPSKIKMYELKEPQPELLEDGNVNFYELNLINKVNKGDWLGERLDATLGTPGKTILGEEIPSKSGKQLPLKYDSTSVEESYDANTKTTTLYAKKTGAVTYKNDSIMVYQYLEIHGDVSFETGNIDFDGYVHVKGAVEENFSVVAEKDIEILGDFGIGAVKEIESKNGCIYIRGGIAGKNKAFIRCNQDLYTKFASDCTIICDGTVNVGYYCMNTNIIAKQVILASANSKIVGGTIEADVKVACSYLGNSSEKKTTIIVKGFDRKEYKEKFDEVIRQIKLKNEELIELKQKVMVYTGAKNLTPEQKMDYDNLSTKFNEIKDALTYLQEKKKQYTTYLRTKGEGEIQINQRAYPNTLIQMKDAVKHLNNTINSTSFFIQDGEIKQS